MGSAPVRPRPSAPFDEVPANRHLMTEGRRAKCEACDPASSWNWRVNRRGSRHRFETGRLRKEWASSAPALRQIRVGEPDGFRGWLEASTRREACGSGPAPTAMDDQPERPPAPVRSGMAPQGVAIGTSVIRQSGMLSARGAPGVWDRGGGFVTEDQAKASTIDWEMVEREYRAGQLSVSEIARQAGCSHTAINKRAKAQGWTRDLSARVREEVSTRLVSDGVSTANARETIDQAATRVVEIVRSHRKDIATGRSVVRALFDELTEGTERAAEIEAAIESETSEDRGGQRRAMMLRAVALPQRAATAASLAGALKTIVALERQAFGIEGEPADDPATKGDLKSALAKLDNGQRDQLRRLAEAVAG